MRRKVPWFLAAVSLFSSTAAADAVRYRQQPEHARAWVIDAGGLFLEEAGKPRRAIKLPEWHWAVEPFACAPDIAIGPRGEVVITSNVLPVLWKIDPRTLRVSVHRLELDADTDKDFGFSELVYSKRSGAYFAVSGLHGSLWRIDPLLRSAQKLGLSQPMRASCALSVQPQERPDASASSALHGKSIHLASGQRSVSRRAAVPQIPQPRQS